MTCRKALAVSMLAMGFSLGVQAEAGSTRASAKAGKPAALKTKQIRQKDGSVVVRLSLPRTTLYCQKSFAKSYTACLLSSFESSESSPWSYFHVIALQCRMIS